jgi:hypothetical protein
MMEKREWQPIATAPRDGTEILICNPEYNVVLTVRANDVWWIGSWNNKDVIERVGEAAIYLASPWFDPTHWMPLPKLPEAA